MDKRERIKRLLNRYRDWHIVVVGCGGTGSNLVPHLCQLAFSLKSEKISIVLADEDLVEPGNIGRQFFIEPDVGNNKARVLQVRYNGAWGVDISYHPHYIRETETLKRLLEPPSTHGNRPVLPILLSCVDNNVSRQVMEAVFKQARNIIYIDAGNSLLSGQVVVGMRHGNKTLLKPSSHYDRNILTDKDEIEVGGTCGRKVVKQPQSLIANMWAAAILLSYVNSIIGLKDLPSHMATFNAHNCVVRPEYLNNGNND